LTNLKRYAAVVVVANVDGDEIAAGSAVGNVSCVLDTSRMPSNAMIRS